MMPDPSSCVTNQICPRITVIAIHFGPYPATIALWVNSVRANPELEFLLYSDHPLPMAAPPNLRIVRSSLTEIRDRAEAALDTVVALTRPYKLCDLRPMYGEIFGEELSGSEFWGHCDLDVVFGRIVDFLIVRALQHDKIFVRGNFSLYRNIPTMNSLFRQGHTAKPPLYWRAILADPANHLFDEWKGIFRICQAQGVDVHRAEVIADIRVNRHSLRRTRASSTVVQEIFFWENGHLTGFSWDGSGERLVRRFLLIHLQKRRLIRPLDEVVHAERVYFTPTGFAAGSRYDVVDFAFARALNGPSLLGDLRIFARRGKGAIRKRLSRVL